MLIGEGYDWRDGVESAWDTLVTLNPEDVCRKTKAYIDGVDGAYVLPFFNEQLFLIPKERRIQGSSGVAKLALDELPHFSTLAILWYLIQAKDIAPSGNLVNPAEVSGGLIFSLGSHRLPLDRLVEEYGGSAEKLIEKGVSLGGEPQEYGDASIRLFPFPKVPVILLIWGRDDEFPARADILFDSTCTEHLPTDILWSTAMMSILVMV